MNDYLISYYILPIILSNVMINTILDWWILWMWNPFPVPGVAADFSPKLSVSLCLHDTVARFCTRMKFLLQCWWQSVHSWVNYNMPVWLVFSVGIMSMNTEGTGMNSCWYYESYTLRPSAGYLDLITLLLSANKTTIQHDVFKYILITAGSLIFVKMKVMHIQCTPWVSFINLCTMASVKPN